LGFGNLWSSSIHTYSNDPIEREIAEQIEKKKQQELVKKSSTYPSLEEKEEKEKNIESNILREDQRNHKRKLEDSNVKEAGEEIEISERKSLREERLNAIKEEQTRLKKEILSISKNRENQTEEIKEKKTALLDERRAKYLEKKREGKMKEEEVLRRLGMFKENIIASTKSIKANSEKREESTSPKRNPPKENLSETSENSEEEDDEESLRDGSWKAHSLKFEKDPYAGDPMAREEEEYTVLDPLEFSKHVKPLSQHQRRLRGWSSTKLN